MKRTLIFAWRKIHVDMIQERSNPFDLIVSLNLDISALLCGLNIPYYEMTDFINTTTVRSLMNDSASIAQTWFQPFEADCVIDGIRPLKIEAITLAPFIADGLIAKHLFTTIADQHDLEKTMLFDHPRDHIVITENGVDIDLWVAVWRVLAAHKQITVEMIPITGEANTSQPSRIKKFKKTTNTIFSVIKNWAAWQHMFIRTKLRREKTGIFAPMINEGYRYAQLYDEISQSLTKGRLIPVTLGSRRIGGIKFKGYVWTYRALSLIPNFQSRALVEQWYAKFLTFQQGYKGDYPELFANTHLSAQFKLLFLSFLPSSVQIYKDTQTIFRRMNTRVVIISTFPILHSASVHAAAQDQHIDVLALPHSGSPTDKDLRLKGNQTLIWTKDFVRTWQSTQASTPMILTGLHPSIITQGYEQTRSWKPSKRARKRVTLLLATNQSGIRQWVNMRQHYETLAQLVKVPAHLQDKIELVFKLHPVHDYEHIYQSLIPPQVDYVKIIRDTSLEEVLNDSDLAILVNITTSAHLLALAHGIPLLYIDTTGDSIIHDQLALANWSEEMSVHSNAQIWPQIERILTNPTERDRLLAANKRYWRRLEAVEHNPVIIIQNMLDQYLQ